MKRLFVVLSIVLAAAPGLRAQVIVTLSNFGILIEPGGPVVWSAPVTDEFAVPLSGNLYKADLMYDATPFGGVGYVSVPSSTPFLGTGNGRFFGGERTIPVAADPGDILTLVVRAWHDPDGLTDFDSATRRGESDPFTIEAVDTDAVPPPLPIQLSNMTSFAIVPEPGETAVVLLAIASGVGILLRRKV
jgi:hypothetical protein